MTKLFLTVAFGLITAQATLASVPTAALTFDTNINPIGLTSTEERKIQDAERKIKDVIASEEFRNAVLNHTYNGRKTFVDNNGLTNLQIYNKILEASEGYKKTKNNTMDMGVKAYYENSNVVGYTTLSSSYININRKIWNGYTSTNATRNLTHEWLHKLGFHHAQNYSKSRDYSVPYGIGSIMEKIAAKY